jgi:two-component system nitrogen regulation response regulator GlnG
MSNVLIIDDEESICWAMREALRDDGHDVEIASSAEEGLGVVASDRHFDAILLDVRLPGIDGLTALAELSRSRPQLPVIIMTAFGNLETAVKAMEEGAFDYLVKPFDLDQAVAVLNRALMKRVNSTTIEAQTPAESRETLIGSSVPMQELFKTIAIVAPTDVPILITGESGTGKELVARAIHRHSPRRKGPFVPVCVPALSSSLVERELFGHVKGSFTGATQDRQGLLELANEGSVLLDEVGDVPLPLQVKLLRAIELREVTPVGDVKPRLADIRVIAATNRPLEEMMAAGQFREDLYFRLSVFPIHIPALRDRREDIPELARYFLRQTRMPFVDASLSHDVIETLQERPWVGNVRELRNAIERAAIIARGQPIRVEHLPPPLSPGPGVKRSGVESMHEQILRWFEAELKSPSNQESLYERFLELVEPALLRAVINQQRGNRAATAEILGIHRATLRQKLKRYSIDPEKGPA